MKYLQCGLIFLSAAICSACATTPLPQISENQPQKTAEVDIKNAFDELNTPGVIVIKDKNGLHRYGNDLLRVASSAVRSIKPELYRTTMYQCTSV